MVKRMDNPTSTVASKKVFKTSIPEDAVMMRSGVSPVVLRAAHELMAIEEEVKSLDGDISDYGATAEDHGLILVELGDDMARWDLQTVFSIFPLKDGDTKLSTVIDDWRRMAATPDIRC